MSSDDDDDVGSGTRATPDSWQYITNPTEHDVLCGRGGGTNNHPGNVKFRLTINDHKLRYLAASKVEKPKVAREVVDVWRSLDPPGRILARRDDSRKGPGSVKAEGNVWYDIGDKKAREKASQCLRERTPDVLPYVREMQRRQDEMTGQGLRLVEQQMRMRNESRGMGGVVMNGDMINDLAIMVNGMTHQNMQPNSIQPTMQPTMQQMIPTMNSVNEFSPSMTQGVLPSRPYTMSEPDINNAFSVEHFFTHGFVHATPLYCAGDDPLSLQQMSQDAQRWDQAGFSGDLQSSVLQPRQVFSSSPNSSLEPVPIRPDFVPINPDTVGSSSLSNAKGLQREDELTLEEYMESMKDIKAFHLDSQPVPPRSDDLSNSWIRSFHDLENNSKTEDMTFDDSNGSFGQPVSFKKGDDIAVQEIKKEIKNEIKKEKRPNKKLDFNNIDKASGLYKQTSTRTHLSAATQKSAMSIMSAKSTQSGMSGFSMMSGMSDVSRGSKLSASRNQASTLSMMSDFTELTDVSETLANLDLHA